MIGVQVTKHDLNTKAGDISTYLNLYYTQALEIKQFLDVHGKPGLILLGFTENESDVMISAFNDLVVSKEHFDSSPFIRQLYGMGFK